MWLFTNRGFVSVVKDRNNSGNLMVRARHKGHIEAIFKGYVSAYSEDADYAYRASIPRTVVTKVMAELPDEITYDNFKNSVKDHDLHVAYLDVWQAMHHYQRKFQPPRVKRVLHKV